MQNPWVHEAWWEAGRVGGTTEQGCAGRGGVVHSATHGRFMAFAVVVLMAVPAAALVWRPNATNITTSGVSAFGGAPVRSISTPDTGLTYVVYSTPQGTPPVPTVYCATSVDKDRTWSVSTVSPGTDPAICPAVDAARPTGLNSPHVVWCRPYAGQRGAIHYRRGSTAAVCLTSPGDYTATRPAIAVSDDGLVLLAVWQTYAGLTYRLRLRRSTDGGVSWGPEVTLVEYPNTPIVGYPSVDIGADLVVHVSWSYYCLGAVYIMHIRSLDAGLVWELPAVVWWEASDAPDDAAADERGPVVCAGANQRVDIAWVYFEMTDNSFSLFATSSTNSGGTWPPREQARRIVGPGAAIGEPSLSSDRRGLAYLTWQQSRGSAGNVLLVRSGHPAEGWSEPTAVVGAGSAAAFPRVAVDPGEALHVAWLRVSGSDTCVRVSRGQQFLSDASTATAYNQQRHLACWHPYPWRGIVYVDNGVIRYSRSDDRGENWTLPESVAVGEYPALAAEINGRPVVAFLRDERDIVIAWRDQYNPVWTQQTVFTGGVDARAFPPALCYSAFPAGRVRCAYVVRRTVAPPLTTQDYVYVSEATPQQVYPAVLVRNCGSAPASAATIAYTQAYPSDRLHVAWEEEGVIRYRERANNVWGAVLPVRDSATCTSPFIEAHGDRVYAVWSAPDQPGGVSETWQKSKTLAALNWPELAENQSQSPVHPSQYPVQAWGVTSVWQEGASASPDIWYKPAGENPATLVSTASASYYPHATIDVVSEFRYCNHLWTENVTPSAYDVWFRRKQLAPTEVTTFYAVGLGDDEPSFYCTGRDSTATVDRRRADWGRSRLDYSLQFLHPGSRYEVALTAYVRAGDTLEVTADGGLVGSVPSAADGVYSLTFELPEAAYADDSRADVAVIRRGPRRGIALLDLAVQLSDAEAGEGEMSEGGSAARPAPQPVVVCRPLSGGRTLIRLDVPVSGRYHVGIYTPDGRRVAVVVDGMFDAGLHELVWDGRGMRGASAGTGVYFCRCETDATSASGKMVKMN